MALFSRAFILTTAALILLPSSPVVAASADQDWNDLVALDAGPKDAPKNAVEGRQIAMSHFGKQEAALRAAVIQRERQARMSQADAEESAGLEIEDARTNFQERFEMAMPEQPPAQAAAQPAVQTAEPTAPQPATQQAAAQTPQR